MEIKIGDRVRHSTGWGDIGIVRKIDPEDPCGIPTYHVLITEAKRLVQGMVFQFFAWHLTVLEEESASEEADPSFFYLSQFR